MAFTTLTFGDFDPVTGPPTLDGLTAIPEAGLLTSEAERGYVQGGRLAYGTSSGFPPVVIDAIRDGSFLQLAVFCRFDLSFDIADTIVVALKPTPGSPQADARRIDIHPVFDDIGADEPGPGGAPDSDVPGIPPSTNANPLYHIRTNHPPAQLNHFRGAAGSDPWTTTNPNPPGGAYTPSNVSVKVRSWTPPVATLTTTPAGPAQALPAVGGVFNVLSTASFPSAGLFRVGASIVRFTGKTATTFTGCTDGSGSIPAGTGVSIPETGWSAELRLPIDSADGGATWIDLNADFGLFVGVIRAGLTPASGSEPAGGFFAAQDLFPTTAALLNGTLDETLAIPAYGTGKIPAEGASPALGVRILGGEAGIGARLASAGNFSALGNGIDLNNDNVFVAQVENTDPGNVANGVTSEVRIANWGMPPADFAAWGRPPGATPNPSAAGNVTNGTPVELKTNWAAANIPVAYQSHKHQCVWVQLSSGAAVNFTNSSDRRNMDFVPLSVVERDAEISGVGYPMPPNGISHDFVLITNTRHVVAPPPVDPGHDGGDGEGGPIGIAHPTLLAAHAAPTPNTSVFLYIVHGYRITGETLTIGERKFQVVGSTGSFGFISEHRGTGDVLTPQLSGPGLKGQGNVQVLEVPHNGTVTIRTRVEAAPPKPAPGPDPGGHKRWFWRLWKAFLRWLRHLVRKLRGK